MAGLSNQSAARIFVPRIDAMFGESQTCRSEPRPSPVVHELVRNWTNRNAADTNTLDRRCRTAGGPLAFAQRDRDLKPLQRFGDIRWPGSLLVVSCRFVS